MKKILAKLSTVAALAVTAMALSSCCCDRYDDCCNPCPEQCCPQPCCPRPCPTQCCPRPCGQPVGY